MTVQTLKDITLEGGIRVRAGAVLNMPDALAADLIKAGLARQREKRTPPEKKDAVRHTPGSPGEPAVSPVLNPGDPLPDPVPYVRVPTDPQPAASYEPGAYEDQDNFVRDLVTFAAPFDWWDGSDGSAPAPPVPPSPSAGNRTPVLTLDEIKLHCHIEPDQTAEDTLLADYEMAAHLNTENYLRYQIDDAVGENIKLAMLLLIGHWYRNREAVSTGRTMQGVEMPLGYKEILHAERDFPIY